MQRSRRVALDPRLIHSLCDMAAVADVFNALTVDHPYRPARSSEAVAGILRDMAGRELSREVVELLLYRWDPPRETAPDAASIAP